MINQSLTVRSPGVRALVRRHPGSVFVLLAYALTWSVWVPRALVSQGWLTAQWPMIVGPYWSVGPAVAAVITASVAGRGALRELGSRLVRWRVRWWWYAIVVLGPGVYWGVSYLLATLVGVSDQLRRPLPVAEGLAVAMALLVVLCLTDGVGEETGWRGLLLPRQLEHLSRPVASCLLGIIWALWHLPLFWTEGYPLAGGSPLVVILELPAVSIIFTWVFVHTKGSALIAIILHGASNWWAVTATGGVAEPWQLTTLLLVSKWILAAAILRAWVRQTRQPADELVRH
jgi:membrane protease YdiL (CAAX protease family)